MDNNDISIHNELKKIKEVIIDFDTTYVLDALIEQYLENKVEEGHYFHYFHPKTQRILDILENAIEQVAALENSTYFVDKKAEFEEMKKTEENKKLDVCMAL